MVRSATEQAISEELAQAWWYAAVSNHHDFITGTAPDRVADGEQRPWLDRALATADAALAPLIPTTEEAAAVTSGAGPPDLPDWRSRGGRIEILTQDYAVELDENAGGSIVSAYCPKTERSLLTGLSNDLVSYRDSGGLWRMGHEYRGGRLKEASRASGRAASLQVQELDGGLEVTCVTELDGQSIKRALWFRSDSPLIRGRVEGRAAERRTVTLRLVSDMEASRLEMDAAGGAVTRRPKKLYDPTFWPVRRFVHIRDRADDQGLALCLAMPSAVSYEPGGQLEVVALRNATRERAFGFVPLLAMPATGHERSSCVFEYAFIFTQAGDWRQNDIFLIARSLAHSPWDETGLARARQLADSLVTADRADVFITAVKPASRGDGLIARLYTLTAAGSPVAVTIRDRVPAAAWLSDARERDLEALEVRDGAVHLTMPGNIATVRLLT